MTVDSSLQTPPVKHLAIIMDGNGRWAKKLGFNRFKGHTRGTEVAEKIIEECSRCGISYLTLFAFSTENWTRPQKEVDFLFTLLGRYLSDKGQELLRQNIRLQTIGDLSRLPQVLQHQIQSLKIASQKNTGLTLIFGLNYGGRQEILNAVQKYHQYLLEQNAPSTDLDHQKLFANFLETASYPAPDLVIRTSGELRISNFMLWQMAYSELYFSNKMWPDFTVADLHAAFQDFLARDRRFGGLKTEDLTNAFTSNPNVSSSCVDDTPPSPRTTPL